MYHPKPSEPRPIYGGDIETIRGKYYPDNRISKLIKQGYKGIYDARTGILTMYKEAEKMEVEEPITLTDEQITEMYESGYISDKERFKDGND